MSTTFDIKIVTPEKVEFEGKTISVVAPGSLGYLGVLKNHAPLITSLGEGLLTYKDEGGQAHSFKIQGGYLEVNQNKLLVLTDKFEK